jgi:hypothetical protein
VSARSQQGLADVRTVARLAATFELRGPGRERIAQDAAELVDALQRLAATPACECDLDVRLDVEATGGG